MKRVTNKEEGLRKLADKTMGSPPALPQINQSDANRDCRVRRKREM
jgi:hypothetical protein